MSYSNIFPSCCVFPTTAVKVAINRAASEKILEKFVTDNTHNFISDLCLMENSFKGKNLNIFGKY
jgi:hypothetical protein